MGKSYRDTDFSERDAQLYSDFYSDVEAIEVAEIPEIIDAQRQTEKERNEELEVTSDEEQAEIVSARWNGDGELEQEEAEQEEPAGQPFSVPSVSSRVERSEKLDRIMHRLKSNTSEWACAFLDVLERGYEIISRTSRVPIRYESVGTGKRISALPDPVTFLADIQITARQALTPALYRIWLAVYYERSVNHEMGLSDSAHQDLQKLVGRAFIKNGISPVKTYWGKRADAEQAASLLRNCEKRFAKEDRLEQGYEKQRRRARRAAAAKITTLAVAA